jgi:hypothetical protein
MFRKRCARRRWLWAVITARIASRQGRGCMSRSRRAVGLWSRSDRGRRSGSALAQFTTGSAFASQQPSLWMAVVDCRGSLGALGARRSDTRVATTVGIATVDGRCGLPRLIGRAGGAPLGHARRNIRRHRVCGWPLWIAEAHWARWGRAARTRAPQQPSASRRPRASAAPRGKQRTGAQRMGGRQMYFRGVRFAGLELAHNRELGAPGRGPGLLWPLVLSLHNLSSANRLISPGRGGLPGLLGAFALP